jgi:hypothetical protein
MVSPVRVRVPPLLFIGICRYITTHKKCFSSSMKRFDSNLQEQNYVCSKPGHRPHVLSISFLYNGDRRWQRYYARRYHVPMKITLGKPRISPQEFSAKWRSSELKERAGAQEHFIDVCALVGAPTPAEVDKKGEFFTFEKTVEKVGGEVSGSEEGGGSADVFLRGCFAWEYKGQYKDLAAAFRQLLLYRIDLNNPPLLVVSDMDRFEVHTNFKNTV